MAIVFEETLKKNIQKEGPSGVYILFGEDGFLKKSYAEKIAKNTADKDDIFNYCRFGENASLQDVYDSAMQLPFMSDKKFIELCDFDFEHCSADDFEKLCTLIADISDGVVFVLRFDSLEFDFKKSTRFKRMIAAAEKSGGMAVNLSHKTKAELVKILSDGASKRGCIMDMSVAAYLIETAGEDINLLSNELTKLCAYKKSGAITKETVDLVSVKTVEASVYNLSKLIMAENAAAALSCLDELFFTRTEPMIILHSISSVYVDMFRVYAAKEKGLGYKSVAEAYGYRGREFVLERANQSLRRFDAKRLNLSLNAITNADAELKSTGADGRIILEKLIIKLIYIISKGEAIDKA